MSALAELPAIIDLRKAPRVWMPNACGAKVRVIHPVWLSAYQEQEKRKAQHEALCAKSRWHERAKQYRREVLRWAVPSAQPKRSFSSDVIAIIEAVAEAHGVTLQDILDRSRRGHIVKARKAAMLAVKAAKPEMSTTQLGHAFNRDHTTIVYALSEAGKGKLR